MVFSVPARLYGYPHTVANAHAHVGQPARRLTGAPVYPQIVISLSGRLVLATGTNSGFTQVIPMRPIVLASTSPIRATLLRNAGLQLATHAARVDEGAIKAALLAEGASPRDIADTLAEMKAERVALRHPDALVIGADQVLEFDGQAFGKPADTSELRHQLLALRGNTHRLLSAAVVFEDGRPVWRHVAQARLTMRQFSDDWLNGYLDRNGAHLLDSVGGYKLESEGVRLFSQIEGDYFTVLGLPLLPLLDWLAVRGSIPS